MKNTCEMSNQNIIESVKAREEKRREEKESTG
jgi:hypothetical protein